MRNCKQILIMHVGGQMLTAGRSNQEVPVMNPTQLPLTQLSP
ncbi:unnamed protein product [Linum tenue]|nr:unnamed protein product [Linum tenue]